MYAYFCKNGEERNYLPSMRTSRVRFTNSYAFFYFLCKVETFEQTVRERGNEVAPPDIFA